MVQRKRQAVSSSRWRLCLAALALGTVTAAQSPDSGSSSSTDGIDLEAVCSSLATVIPPMMAAGAAPSQENITLDHVFTKYYPTGYNLPSHELFLDLPPGTLLASDDAKGSIQASGTDWEAVDVPFDMQYGLQTPVQGIQGGLPSFCRFGATIVTSELSQVYAEVWLPLPDTVPTITTDPDPIPYDNSTTSDTGDGDYLNNHASPALRLQPLPRWIRYPFASWEEGSRRRKDRRHELHRRQILAAARRPPAGFIPAPDTAWQGRMIHIGSAAAKGAIIWPDMKRIISRYHEVVVADNSGHFSSATSQEWATNDPTRRDSGYRAVHLSTMLGQVVTKTLYGVTTSGPQRQPSRRAAKDRPSTTESPLPYSVPTTTAEDGDYSDVAPFMNLTRPYSSKLGFYSYFLGCSMGGRQGLSEAGLFPADYDGILAGSPAISFTNTSAWQIWINEKVSDPKAVEYIPPSAYDNVRNAVLRACDGLDGVLDGVVSNTTACTFDLFVPLLACADPAKSGKGCFSLLQLANLVDMYSNFTINGDLVHTGLLPGSEEAWSAPSGLWGTPFPVASGWFQYQLLNITSVKSAAFDPFIALTPELIAMGNAVDPGRGNTWYTNLSPFLTHGKLLHTHGLADQLIPPGESVRYYQEVNEAVGRQKGGADFEVLSDSYRLFLVPGMGHCRTGSGPWNFGGAAQTNPGARPLSFDARHDATLALFNWVENGTNPEYLVGAAYQTKEEQAGYRITETTIEDDRRFGYGVKYTRKLCPWPLQAHLKANATRADVAASFNCE
ncbi:unnamed protein product [Tilletia controversa]|uniref:Carboxylic ester hydrolase n=3 Tax=Tilletia TaxID=13289 RepID=A0A8X7MQN4_9BASI|nr:hypothetical protein CF336_g8151 [Tilletia laevis]KAE8194096.1 hypothetical protein CF328_g4854 [Tilletia controversa]KAE8260164.1 hypothetical protein A4X03_0g3895 [Tilletia caries]KAE8185316.1 hypothetical protein CF335_g7756 [Tilletia laevis]KAE8245486.1 hypothetical protein A4X06_0g5670 [Tilletia controversa]